AAATYRLVRNWKNTAVTISSRSAAAPSATLWANQSEVASPPAVVSRLTPQNSTPICGTLAASGSGLIQRATARTVWSPRVGRDEAGGTGRPWRPDPDHDVVGDQRDGQVHGHQHQDRAAGLAGPPDVQVGQQ